MTKIPLWQYDEFGQVGVDYSDLAEVEAYDKRHAQFRDVEQENNAILDTLQIDPGQSLIEFGTGTGALAIQAAQRGIQVTAVDVSQAMLDYARSKASKNNISNITFRHGGFLTYTHNDNPVDAMVTCVALHHLPDFWKGIALRRMNDMLKPNGRLYISDVIYEEQDILQNIPRWIGSLERIGGETLRTEVETHIREEYSTFDWIMDELLQRAGFRIARKNPSGGVMCNYLCTKTEDDE